ncbi:DUF1294 domain-containing protein [Luteolibacter soli]|uniref:DUF1294 domain-containing protein n=1 Tax=Luteolibacter soli TaxID=3135280 RepID=A0ABU9AV30_9BACT
MNAPTNQTTAGHQGQEAQRKGRLAQWEDARGFGWVQAEGLRIFAHIRDFERGQPRPVAGDEVTFTTGVDVQGRACAKRVRLVRTTGRIGVGAWLLLAALLVLPLFSTEYLPLPKWEVPTVMAVASAVAWICYRSDKRRAESRQWRIKEARLHLIELLGGWPGAFLAQRRFRHKTRKVSFQFIFISIVILHQLVAVDVILGHALSRRVLRELSEVLEKKVPSGSPRS